MEEGTCKICFHLLQGAIGADLKRDLYCKRNPPTALLRGNQILGQFAPTQPDWVCGEFKIRPIALN